MDGLKPNYRVKMQKKGKCSILFHTVKPYTHFYKGYKSVKINASTSLVVVKNS